MIGTNDDGMGKRNATGGQGAKIVVAMVVVQVAFAGVNVLYKLAAEDGMNLSLLVAYRLLFATAVMTPLALFCERKRRPKLTWMVLFQAFCCGLFGGALGQNLYLKSLALTSATYAAAMANLIPGITFIFAISCGLEKLAIGRIEGKAKVLGTLTGIAGAMLLTFYKGFEIHIWSTHIDLLNRHGQPHHDGQPATANHAEPKAWVLGSLLAVGSCVSYSLWLTIQSKMAKRYPCHYSGCALLSAMGSVQAMVFALCSERDWSQWKLGWNIRLLTAAFAGIVSSGVCVALVSWCIHVRGPLFASVFNPLTLVLVALAGSLVLNEKLHLGSVLGAGLIVCGLYLVLWGKGKETKRMNHRIQDHRFQPSSSASSPSSLQVVVVPSVDTDDDTKDNQNVAGQDGVEIVPESTTPTSKKDIEGKYIERQRA